MPSDNDFDDDRPRRRPPRDDDRDDRTLPPRRRRDSDDDSDRRPPPKKGGAGVVIGVLVGVFVLCCGGLGGLGYWIYSSVKPAMQKAVALAGEGVEAEQSRQNLNRIANAIQNHGDVHGVYPQNSFEDVEWKLKGKANPSGKPLLSWRVHLLPLLNED